YLWRDVLAWEVKPSRLLRDARLDRTFDRITHEVVGTGVVTSPEKSGGLPASLPRQTLKFTAIHQRLLLRSRGPRKAFPCRGQPSDELGQGPVGKTADKYSTGRVENWCSQVSRRD